MITKNTIKLIQSLKQQKYRKEQQLFVVEGRKMVAELMESGFDVVGLYATERYLEANETHFDGLETVTEVQMEQMSGQDTAPGILAVARIPQQSRLRGGSRLVLALDGIANPGNMGTIIRTADWFGIRQIVCSNDTVSCFNPKVVQSTMGGLFRTHISYTDLPSYLAQAKGEGYKVFGALLDGSNVYQTPIQPGRNILVIGNESKGITPEVQQLVDQRLLIPNLGGTCESLNAAVATAILCSEMMRSQAR